MVYTGDDQKEPMSSTLTEEQAEATYQFLAEALIKELDMSEKEFAKAQRLANTLLTTIQRHVPFSEYPELLTKLPDEWKMLGTPGWEHIPYQERMKAIFPLPQEIIQQDQLDRNFDILYTEDALNLLQGFFKIVRTI